jgi:hypothetical protein
MALIYGQEKQLLTPATHTREAYRTQYRQRLDALNRHGVYALPAGADPLLYCAYPTRLNQAAIELLVEGMTAQLMNLAHKQFTVEPIAW